MPIIPGENNGTPSRRESDRDTFSFPSSKHKEAALFAKHFGDVKTGADWSNQEPGRKGIDAI